MKQGEKPERTRRKGREPIKIVPTIDSSQGLPSVDWDYGPGGNIGKLAGSDGGRGSGPNDAWRGALAYAGSV